MRTELIDHNAATVWGESDLMRKVREPIAVECRYLREDLLLFTYLDLAAAQPPTDALL